MRVQLSLSLKGGTGLVLWSAREGNPTHAVKMCISEVQNPAATISSGGNLALCPSRLQGPLLRAEQRDGLVRLVCSEALLTSGLNHVAHEATAVPGASGALKERLIVQRDPCADILRAIEPLPDLCLPYAIV